MSSGSVLFSFRLDLFSDLCDPHGHVLHLLLLAPVHSLVSSLLLRDQNHEILLLRQQLLIMRRQLGRKQACGRLEKVALSLAALRLSKQRLASALLIVRPDTLLRWASRGRLATLDFPP